MKRTVVTLWSVATVVMALAITAGPAVAKTDYGAHDPVTGSDRNSAGVSEFTSINAVLGESKPAPEFTSINAVLGEGQSARAASPVKGAVYRSPNSIVGSTQPVSEPETPVVQASSGFDWEDALVGALTVIGLALISLTVVFTLLRRHQRVSLEPRA